MKSKLKSTLLLLFSVVAFQSCIPIEPPEFQTEYKPVFMSRTDLEASVKLTSPKQMINPGKMYYKAPYIFINEVYKGVHIINNQDPSNPENIGFIQAPGNVDIAMKDDILYLDSSVDLLGIEFTGSEITLVKRVTNAFPELLPPDVQKMPQTEEIETREEGILIVGWEKK